MKKINIAVVGLGNIGSYFVKTVLKNRNNIAKKTGKIPVIKYISARNYLKKRTFNKKKFIWKKNPLKVLSHDVDVVVELVGGSSGIAKKLVFAALRNKKHVITANKALIAKHGNRLIKLSESNGVSFLYEAAVAGAIPIIKVLKESTSSNNIDALYGILNGTSNYILTSMEEGQISFDTALKNAQDLGFAESDPTFDIEGYDAAHKLAILSSIIFSQEINFNDVNINGITNISLDDIKAAGEYGYKIKLLGISKKINENVIQNVRPCLIPNNSQLAKINYEQNAIVVKGNYFGELLLSGPGAGRYPTSSAVMSDLFDLLNNSMYPSLGTPFSKLHKEREAGKAQENNRYYLSFLLPDVSGTVASITNIMAKNNISIDDITQRISKKMHKDNLVPVTLITSKTNASSINKAVEEINKNNYTSYSPNIIKIEDL